jgi:cytochrome oxidase Cu insertion factor (SCO1/SenC/PrrC family)
MRRSSLITSLVVGLSLTGLTCQKSGQAPAGGTSANSATPANAANAAQTGASPQQQPAAPVTHLKVGDPAPDFELTDTEGQKVRLSDFRGKKNVVLAFYVLAFTGG